jgi:hypothetical protein
MGIPKSLRLSEQWYHRGLWLVALVFAGFLTALAGHLVKDLPLVERSLSVESFIDKTAADPIQAQIDQAGAARRAAEDDLEQSELKLEAAKKSYGDAKETFENWVATRRATGQVGQDAEVIARTKALDGLNAEVKTFQAQVSRQKQVVLDASQARDRATASLEDLRRQAQAKYDKAKAASDLRIFLYRLALTLPLLAIAGWLFARQRKSTWWPFVWGFIIFSLYVFFVELVPYLPDFGGYVRILVGLLITTLVGRWAILALNRYLANLKTAEQRPQEVRRDDQSYESAVSKLSKSVCPSCERPVDLANPERNFCHHCGTCLFNPCTACGARKNAFVRFCHACGAPAEETEAA